MKNSMPWWDRRSPFVACQPERRSDWLFEPVTELAPGRTPGKQKVYFLFLHACFPFAADFARMECQVGVGLLE